MEEEIETPFLSEEVNLKKVTPFHIFFQMARITAWRRFAHHPTCSKYSDHYYTIGKAKFCVGCTSLYSSIILFLILYGAIYPLFRQNPLILAILFVSGCLSPFIHLMVRPKNKWMKTLFRSFAGVGIGAYIGLIIMLRTWWLQIILVAFIVVSFALYGMIRGTRANQRYCDTCYLFTAEPPCKPISNTNIKIDKLNKIVKEELKKSREKKEIRKGKRF